MSDFKSDLWSVFDNNVKYDLSTNRILGRANYFNTNLVLKSGSFNVYNIDYTHRFLDKSSISISGLYEYAMIDGYTKNRNLRADNYADTLQYTLNTGENPLDAYRIKIDYEKTIGLGKMTVGYQFRNQLQKGIFNYFAPPSKPITTPKSATPSIKAAAIIIVVVIFPEASGLRAIPSTAEPPILPIPIPAPRTAKPAPIAAILPYILYIFKGY